VRNRGGLEQRKEGATPTGLLFHSLLGSWLGRMPLSFIVRR